MLTINGIVGNTPVNIVIYDSQIHSGTVLTVPANVPSTSPTCSTGDQAVPTDAYVLQGGSATGCDTGDAFEVTDNNPNAVHQMPGATDITLSAGPGSPALPGTGFHIETHYLCSGSVSLSGEGGPGECGAGESLLCNTSGTICANPDTGFLTVTNNTGEVFTGTITLQGNSPIQGGSFCASNGTAVDTWTSGLGTSDSEQPNSVTLALGTMGSDGPNFADSSNCGGFNFDQASSPMATPTQASTFLFGGEKFTVTPTNINVGDVLTFRPVPVPNNQFDLPGLTLPGNAAFGANQQCVSMADFSAPTGANLVNSVCPEIQTHCFTDATLTTPCSDAETFVWSGELDGHLDPTNPAYQPVSGVPEIGGVHFLGAPGVNCLQNSFSEDIITSYAGDTASDLPLKSGGSGLNCFAATFDPAVTKTNPVGPGVVVSAFSGFKPPVVDSDALVLNRLFPIEPLGFTVSNGAGGAPITNLHWCPSPAGSTSPTGCGTAKFPIPKPWVTFSQIPLNAPGCPTANFSQGPIIGLLVNFGKGNYWFNWVPQIIRDDGCATVQVQFSFGTTVQPASFIYP
jgi:hypothetical protein